MLDELARKARDGITVPWDELREQRVLNETLGQLEAPTPSARERSVEPRRRWGAVVGAAVVAAAAAAVITFVVARPPGESPAPIARTQTTAAETSSTVETGTPAARDHSVLRLRDGSVVTLGPEAEVEVLREASDVIALRQTGSSVSYLVPEVDGRTVRVEVRSVSIATALAAFSVNLEKESVTVVVERGVVTVDHADRELRLTAGERVTVNSMTEAAVAPDASEDEGAAETAPDAAPEARPARPTAVELMRIADEARRAGRAGSAVEALRQMARLYPHDRRVPAALFTLGRIEQGRGRHEAAARAFERCFRAQRDGPLASDALADAASAWMGAGRHEKARKAAARYLARFSDGLHAATMHEIMR